MSLLKDALTDALTAFNTNVFLTVDTELSLQPCSRPRVQLHCFLLHLLQTETSDHSQSSTSVKRILSHYILVSFNHNLTLFLAATPISDQPGSIREAHSGAGTAAGKDVFLNPNVSKLFLKHYVNYL